MDEVEKRLRGRGSDWVGFGEGSQGTGREKRMRKRGKHGKRTLSLKAAKRKIKAPPGASILAFVPLKYLRCLP